MTDRANGWLLILGGLAIGLVLWLSPSEVNSRSFQSLARQQMDRLIRRLSDRAESSCQFAATGANGLW